MHVLHIEINVKIHPGGGVSSHFIEHEHVYLTEFVQFIHADFFILILLISPNKMLYCRNPLFYLFVALVEECMYQIRHY
jgi:hypothetical protein